MARFSRSSRMSLGEVADAAASSSAAAASPRGGAPGRVQQGRNVAERACRRTVSWRMASSGEGSLVAEVGQQRDGLPARASPRAYARDRKAPPRTPEGHAARRWRSSTCILASVTGFAVGGQQRRAPGGDPGGPVVVQQQSGHAGKNGIGAAAQIRNDERFGSDCLEPFEDGGRPRRFKLQAHLRRGVCVAGLLERLEQDDCSGQAVGVGVGKEVNARLLVW